MYLIPNYNIKVSLLLLTVVQVLQKNVAHFDN
jgi:hypothetical protein